jgi:branched-chain amino acid transport system substrate-binding protein
LISLVTLTLALAAISAPDSLAPASVAELRTLPAATALERLSDTSEATAFLKAEQTLRAGRAQEAQALAQAFETTYPGSILTYRARLVEAWSSLALGDHRHGCQILSEVARGTDRGASTQARETVKEWVKSGKLSAEAMLALPSDFPVSDSLSGQLAMMFSQTYGSSPLIVLLPSTGPYASIGKRVARGALLAAEDAKVKAIQIDEPSDPIEAALLVRGMLRVTRPRAVVGPLLSNTSVTVAQEMARFATDVPLLLPTATSPGVSRLSPWAWQVNVTTAQQGIEAARRARKCLNASEAYLIWPKGEFGDAVSQGFRDEFERLGGRIAWQRSYAAGNTDFRATLESLRKSASELARRRGQDTTKLAPLVFSPGENPTEAAALAGQASSLGMKPQWLGASGWHSRQFLIESTGRMDGTIVVTDNIPDETRPTWKIFSQKWRSAGLDAPDRLAALGWDAAQLALLPKLPPASVFVGAQGDIEFDSAGRNNDKVEVLQVEKGAFVAYTCPTR